MIADMNDLFNYPAYHRNDVNGGGGIYQVIEYSGALYVVICTGTPETKNESGTLQTFAIVKGVCNGDVTDKDAWSWSLLAGDKEDEAKYPFGFDEERISAGRARCRNMTDIYISVNITMCPVHFGSLHLEKISRPRRPIWSSPSIFIVWMRTNILKR